MALIDGISYNVQLKYDWWQFISVKGHHFFLLTKSIYVCVYARIHSGFGHCGQGSVGDAQCCESEVQLEQTDWINISLLVVAKKENNRCDSSKSEFKDGTTDYRHVRLVLSANLQPRRQNRGGRRPRRHFSRLFQYMFKSLLWKLKKHEPKWSKSKILRSCVIQKYAPPTLLQFYAGVCDNGDNRSIAKLKTQELCRIFVLWKASCLQRRSIKKALWSGGDFYFLRRKRDQNIVNLFFFFPLLGFDFFFFISLCRQEVR